MQAADQMSRFLNRLNRAHNLGLQPTRDHLDAQNVYTRPPAPRKPRVKPEVRAYQAGAPGTRPWPTQATTPPPVDAALERQRQIAATRLHNLEIARAVKAAKHKEDRTMNRAAQTEIDTLRAQIAALTARLDAQERPTLPTRPRPTAPAPKAEPTAPAFVTEYLQGRAKLADLGHGRREATIKGTKVSVAWNPARKTWDYACGKRSGSAADRGAAFKALNALTVKAGLGQVRP